MRPTIITALLVSMGIGSASFAQQAFTLDEALKHAFENNEAMKQAMLDVQISEARVKETTAIGLPQLSGEANMNYYIDIPTQVAPADALNPAAPPDVLVPLQFGLPYSATAGITASQLIFDGSYFVGLKASKAYVNYSILGQEKNETELREQVSQTYFAVQMMKETLESLEQNKEAIEQSATQTNALYEVGFLESQDADQVKLALSNINFQIESAKRQKEDFERILKFQMGLDSGVPLNLTDEFESLLESAQTGEQLDQNFVLERHIDYRTVLEGERLSSLNISNDRAKNYPQLAAFFNHSQNGFSTDLGDIFSNDFYPTTIVGLQLNVPIWSSGQRHFKTQQSKLELEKTLSQKRQVEQNLLLTVESAKRGYRSAMDNLELAKDNLELAETIRATTNVKYNEGLASSLDYAQAESQYLQTLATYVQTAQQVFNAKLALDKALGN